MTRMQAETRAAEYNADRKRTTEGRSYSAQPALIGSSEWYVATHQRGKVTWREYE